MKLAKYKAKLQKCTNNIVCHILTQLLRSGSFSLVIILITGADFILKNKKTPVPYFDLIFYSFCVFCSSSLLSHGRGTENARLRSMDRMRSYSSHCSIHLGRLNRLKQALLVLVNMETQYFIFSSGKVIWNPGNMFPISQAAKKRKLIFWSLF